MTEKTPAPEISAKQEEIDKISTKLRAELSKFDSLEKQKDYIINIAKDEDNRQIFFDEESLEKLIDAVKAYQGQDLPEFVAKMVCDTWEKEGKFSDPLKYSIESFKKDRIKKGYVVINEVFYYRIEKEQKAAHIHLNNPYDYINKRTAGSDLAVIRSFIKGLNQFAQKIKNDPDVDEITATSELLSNPAMINFLQSLGFQYIDQIPDHIQKHFDPKKDVRHMVADKDTFVGLAGDAKSLREKMFLALKDQ